MAEKTDKRITEDTPESQLPLDYVAAYGPEHKIGYMTPEQGKVFDAKRAAEAKAWRESRSSK